MIVGSIKEDLSLERRVSITPETAKNIISLGLKICIEHDYATHIGIQDEEYKNVGVEIKSSPKEVLDNSNLLVKVNCPSEKEISNLLYRSTAFVGDEKLVITGNEKQKRGNISRQLKKKYLYKKDNKQDL